MIVSEAVAASLPSADPLVQAAADKLESTQLFALAMVCATLFLAYLFYKLVEGARRSREEADERFAAALERLAAAQSESARVTREGMEQQARAISSLTAALASRGVIGV